MLQTSRFARLLLSSLAGTALAVAAIGPAAASGSDEQLLRPTPLVLKDGRIAEVSIYTIPFLLDSPDPDPAAKAGLERLIDSLADDCFLTAQAIGHVEKQDTPGDDALAGHRLARARADSIQAAMVARGLPASAIASVWDWQFAVREPRVTLWVFRLDRGDDCKGTPLERPAVTASAPGAAPSSPPPPAAQAAAAAAPPGPAAVGTSAADTSAAAPAPAEPVSTAAAEAGPAAPAAAPPPVTPPTATAAPASPPPATADASAADRAPASEVAATPAEPVTVAQAPEKPEPSEAPVEMLASAEPQHGPALEASPAPAAPSAAAPPPAAAPRPVHKPAVTGAAPPAAPAAKPRTAAVAPSQASRPPASAGSAEAPATGALAITFDMNSSYFPDGAHEQLKALAQTLERGRSYRIELIGSVADDAVGGASDRQAEAYNRWIAERRVNRVAEYLQKNADAFSLQIEQDYAANDPSRRVVVKVRPQS